MLNWIWGIMVLMGILYGLICGNAGVLSAGMMDSAGDAVTLIIKMAGGFMLWNGLFEILEQSGAAKAIAGAMKPILGKLFRGVKTEESMTAMTMNLTMNMLGLGNAATPMGLRAMESLQRESDYGDSTSPAMCMFLVINASSIQLLPTTVLTLRRAAGSFMPEAVIWPTLCATAVSTLAGIFFCKLFEKGDKRLWKS